MNSESLQTLEIHPLPCKQGMRLCVNFLEYFAEPKPHPIRALTDYVEI